MACLIVLLTLPFWLAAMSPAMAGTVHCTTRQDPQFKRLVTTRSDGNRAVTRDDEELQRWNTQITPAPWTRIGAPRDRSR
jgi:hypothetical protein